MVATTRTAPATPIITINSITNMGGEIGVVVVVDETLELVDSEVVCAGASIKYSANPV